MVSVSPPPWVRSVLGLWVICGTAIRVTPITLLELSNAMKTRFSVQSSVMERSLYFKDN